MADRRIAAPPNERIVLRYSGTYYIVYSLDAFMSREDITTRSFSDHFFEGIEYYVAPFERWTALHEFTEFFIDQLIVEDFDRASRTRYIPRGACTSPYCRATPAWLLAADLMKSHELDASEMLMELDRWVEAGAPCCPDSSPDSKGPDFDVIWDLVDHGAYEKLLQQLTEEVFFVLFGNRTFLYKFHSHLARWVQFTDVSTAGPAASLFRKRGTGGSTLKRARIPEWAKRAAYFRDRGRCCKCERDLGGTYSPVNRAEYDHIVSLAVGGMNDASNIQLLCDDCNNEKRAKREEPSKVYERWFPVDRHYHARSVPTLESVVRSI